MEITKTLVFVFALMALPASAEKKLPLSSSAKVLNFDAVVIEGERRTPGIFLEFNKHAPTLDSVILQRTDFSDFTDLERIPLRYQTPGN